MKTLLAAACLLPMLAGPALAQAGDPAAPIKTLDAALVTALKTGGQPFATRYAALAPAVDQAFNLPQILQTVVGLRWAAIPADGQKRLLATFRAYTIASYADNFKDGADTRIDVLPETRAIGQDHVIETQIVPKTGDSTRLDYVMRQAGGGWKAIDVLEQATISQVAVQRSDFRSLLSGGGADKLIASLQGKIDTMSGGTIKP